jgi:hypothetical protein
VMRVPLRYSTLPGSPSASTTLRPSLPRVVTTRRSRTHVDSAAPARLPTNKPARNSKALRVTRS